MIPLQILENWQWSWYPHCSPGSSPCWSRFLSGTVSHGAMERKLYRGSFSSRTVEHGGAMLEQTDPEGHGEDPCWNMGKVWRGRRSREELLGRILCELKQVVTCCHISHKDLSLPALNSKAQICKEFKEVQLKATQSYPENKKHLPSHVSLEVWRWWLRNMRRIGVCNAFHYKCLTQKISDLCTTA